MRTKFPKKLLIFTLITIFLIFSSLTFSETSYKYSIYNIKFESDLEFSTPLKTGVSALSLIYPKKSTLSKAKFIVTMILYSKEMLVRMQMDDSKLLNYTKSVYLGIALPAKKYITREIFKKAVKGEFLSKKIPVQCNVEVFLISLNNGLKLALAFEYFPEISQVEAERIIAKIVNTMQQK